MKNITRRVFIKGMAVAAVATAASTVLTGCKLPAGVTDVTTSVANNLPQTKTITVDGKTFTITAKEFAQNADGRYGLKLKVTNDLGKKVVVYCSNPYDGTTNTTGHVHTTDAAMNCFADIDGKATLSNLYSSEMLKTIASSLTPNDDGDYVFFANTDSADYTVEETLILPNPINVLSEDLMEDWKVLTLTFSLVTLDKKKNPVVEEVRFSFNRV